MPNKLNKPPVQRRKLRTSNRKTKSTAIPDWRRVEAGGKANSFNRGARNCRQSMRVPGKGSHR